MTHIIDAIGDAKIVLLGEASARNFRILFGTGTIINKTNEEKGFSIIGVEGDWPSSRHVNRYIKGYEDGNKTPRRY